MVLSRFYSENFATKIFLFRSVSLNYRTVNKTYIYKKAIKHYFANDSYI